MKAKLFPLIALLFALATAVVAWQQQQTATRMKARVTALAGELKDKSDALEEQASLIARLREENKTHTKEKVEPRDISEPTGSKTPASAAPTTTGHESSNELLRRRMHDPQTRERIRQQVMSMVKQTYTDFAKMHHLTPAQSEQFFDLLTERDMSDAEDTGNFMAGDKDDSGTSGRTVQSAEVEWKEAQRQLRALLSESGYANFQDYEKTVSERSTLVEIRQELAMNNQPLSADQSSFLSQVLFEESSKMPRIPFDPRNPGRGRDKYRFAIEDDNLARYLEAESELDRRVLARAKAILSPEQYEALETYQRQHSGFQRAEIEMARKAMSQRSDGD